MRVRQCASSTDTVTFFMGTAPQFLCFTLYLFARRYAPGRHVLLVSHALIGGYQNLAAFSIGTVQQLSVAQFRPFP